VRVDGAGATHDLLTHLEALNTARRTASYTVGWKIGEADEQAIAKLPETAWETAKTSPSHEGTKRGEVFASCNSDHP
jgi:hypothetical protein